MNRMLKCILSLVLAAALLVGYIPMQASAMEPIRLTEDEIVEETAASGAFYLASSSAKLDENVPGPYYLRVARGGDILPAAKLRFEMMDISAKYGTDYTVSVTGAGLFGPEIENADTATSLMEAFSAGGYEEAMIDENGNDLSLTDEAAQEERQRVINDIDEQVGGALDEYSKAKAQQDGIDLESLSDTAADQEDIDLANSAAEDPQSELSRAFEEQTGLIDDRTPIQNSSSDSGSPEDLLYAGYGMSAMNDMASALEVPALILDFAEGETEKNIVITIKNNSLGEGDKMMVGKLVSDTEDIIVAEVYGGFTMTIADDESWEDPVISFTDAEYSPDGGYAKVTVKREGLSTMVSTAHMTSGNGTAVSGQDYSQVDTDIVFPYGVSERMVKIPVRSEYLDTDSDFTLTLSDPVSADLGDAEAAVIIPKDAESYDPEDLAASGGNDATVNSVFTADSIDLSETLSTKVITGGYARMDGDHFAMKAQDKNFKEDPSVTASWNLPRSVAYSGVQIDWKKKSDKPSWTDTEVDLREAPSYNYTNFTYQTRLSNSTERWERKTTNIYAENGCMGAVKVYFNRLGGVAGHDVLMDIYSIKPIYRPFKIQLADANTESLKFVNKQGKLVPYDEIDTLSYIGSTELVGGDLKFAEPGRDEVTVELKDSRYCWIQYLEAVSYDTINNKWVSRRLTSNYPQGTRAASFKLTPDLLNGLTASNGLNMITFEKNGDQGLKGTFSVRAVLAPYPMNMTVEEDNRAEIKFNKPAGAPANWEWHKGDYLNATVRIADDYADKYIALGIAAFYHETSDDPETTRHWDYEGGKNYVSEQMKFESLIIKPWLTAKDNMLIVKIMTSRLQFYDTTKGFFPNARQIAGPESNYTYYAVLGSDELKSNTYYELEAIPKDEYYIANWKPAAGKTIYYENTFYFRTSIEKDENIVELRDPDRAETYLKLKGSAFYSGATLDKRSEGEAWIPAEGALVFTDANHYAVADQDGNFTVDPMHEGQMPIFCNLNKAITYKVICGGNTQYYTTTVTGKIEDSYTRVVDTGKLKVPYTDEFRPYVAAVSCKDIDGVTTNDLPITNEGLSSVKVTINNCGSVYGNNKREKVRTVELLSYHPSNTVPTVISTLSKDDKDYPYKPTVDDETEIWNFQISFDSGSGVVSGDKLYVRITTDRVSSEVFDEFGEPVTDSALSATTYPPVDTGTIFYQPAAEEPDTYDADFLDGDFMKEYFSLPILGSMNALFKISNVALGFTSLPNGGQRISVGYIPAFAGKRSEYDGMSDTGVSYGMTDFSKAWNDISKQGELLKSTGQRLNVFNSGGVSAFFGIYLDYGIVLDDNNPKLEFMGGGAYLGAIAWYRVVCYFTIAGFPVYFGGDTQLNFMLSAGIHNTEEEQTSSLVYKGSEYGFDWSVSGNLSVTIFAGAGICGVIGVRGGAYLTGSFIYWPSVAKWYAKEDKALKDAGYEDGLRNMGLKLNAGFKFWFDAVIATIPFTIKELVDKPYGYYEDLNRINEISANNEGLATTGANLSTDVGDWFFKDAGDPSVWTAGKKNALRSTFQQTDDITLKMGGYEHADPQMLDLGDDMYLLVYVDEDIAIEGDDRTVLRYQIYNNSDDEPPTWLDVPGEICAMDGSKKVNGALEPSLTDAGDKVLITWTAVSLPDDETRDIEYFKNYLRGRDVYAATVSKDTLKNASVSDPAAIEGSLVSGENNYYNSSPSGMYYQSDGKDYFGITYLSSEAEPASDDLSEAEEILTVATPMLNNSYIRTAQYNSGTGKWENSFGAAKLNSAYDPRTRSWQPISDDPDLSTDNNPTVIDFDSTVWGDWAVYTFTVDKDNDIATDEDKEIYVKLENTKTRFAAVNQLTHDGAYVDADGTEHLGVAKSRTQLAQSDNTVYLFWKQGTDDVAWIDLGEVLNSDKTDKSTGIITDTSELPISFVFYPTYGSEITPTYNSFCPFVDDLDNLYIVWLQTIEEDGVNKQELYASALINGAEGEESSGSWSDPVRLTETDAGDYNWCFNDEPALVALGGEELLVVCNRFAMSSDDEDVSEKDVTMHGIRFETVASVKPVEVTADNPLPGADEAVPLTITVKNDGLKTANGIVVLVLLADKKRLEEAGGIDAPAAQTITTFSDFSFVIFDDLKLNPSETFTFRIDEETFPDRMIDMPKYMSEGGYSLYVSVGEMKEGVEEINLYNNYPCKRFDVINVNPVYSINLSADTYRGEKGTLGSNDFVFNAVINNTGNISTRGTDRLVVGPANLHSIGEVKETEYYLDVPLSELENLDTGSGDGKKILSDLKIDPSAFTYGYVNLYADIVDKDYNSLGAATGFTISTDKPYSVTVKDSETDETLNDTITLMEGESLALSGSYEPSSHFRGGEVVYSVDDSGIATVDEHGSLTAVSAGTTTLYASVDIYDAVRTYTVTVTPDPSYILGDADGDGKVSVLDATVIQKRLATVPVPDTFNEKAACVDGIPTLHIIDATYIQKWLASIKVPYEIGKRIRDDA